MHYNIGLGRYPRSAGVLRDTYEVIAHQGKVITSSLKFAWPFVIRNVLTSVSTHRSRATRCANTERHTVSLAVPQLPHLLSNSATISSLQPQLRQWQHDSTGSALWLGASSPTNLIQPSNRNNVSSHCPPTYSSLPPNQRITSSGVNSPTVLLRFSVPYFVHWSPFLKSSKFLNSGQFVHFSTINTFF
jgi:hypothetical protein